MLRHLRTFFSDRRIVADGFVFFFNALLFGFWVTRLPEIKERLDLSEGQLGLALFFAPIGSIIATLLGGVMSNRFGEGRVTVVSFAVFFLFMPIPVVAPSYLTFMAALAAMGFIFGTLDVAMNAIASKLETETGDHIMSVFHGFFSLGGMAGALIGGWFIASGIPAWQQMAWAGGGGLLLILVWIGPILWPIQSRQEGEAPLGFRWPGKAAIGLALIALCTMVGEGSVADWSAIYLKDVSRADPFFWGWGFAAFSATMTTGRFLGDYIISRMGRKRVVQVSSVFAALGAATVMTVKTKWAIFGFALIGVGYACMIPVVFSRAGALPGLKPAEGISMVAGLGYFGFLAGPVIFGGVAEVAGLRVSWLLLILLGVLSFSLAKKAA